MTLAELINSLCKKAGITETNPHLKIILSSAELSKMEVNKEISDVLEGSLMTEEAALANTAIRAKFRDQVAPEILNGIDAEMDNLVTAAGFDPDDVAEFKKAGTSYKRMRAIATKMDSLIKKKSGSKNDTDRDALTKQINELNSQLAAEKLKVQETIKAESEKFAAREQDMRLEMHLGGYKYANDVDGNDVVRSANISTAKNVLAQMASQAGVKYVFENGGWKLVKQDGTDYFDPKTQTKVDFKTFTEQGIAPLLKVTDPDKGKGAGSGTGGAGASNIPPPSSGTRSMDAAYQELRG